MQEIELKLSLPFGHQATILSALDERLGPQSAHQVLDSTYYDTPDSALREKRISLRLRRQGEQWIQTLKGKGGVSAGLHQRLEWNWELPGPTLELQRLHETGLNLDLEESLQPVFRTVFDRTTWLVAEGQSRIEVALDNGRIEAGGRQTPLFELELELVEGQKSDIWLLAEKIIASVPGWLGFVSKAQRGLALAGIEPLVVTPKPADWIEALQLLSATCDRLNTGDGAAWRDYLLALTALRWLLPDSAGEYDRHLSMRQEEVLEVLRDRGLHGYLDWAMADRWNGDLALRLLREVSES